ncbi:MULTISPECIES: hypothetical protein [Mycobacterium]|nr:MULTISPECIES: hypothetical protein [Mycobacterium]BDE14451.1 hypothetical protein MKCMC460_33110 [Mycobacterium sp. 20KCMC460]GLB92798.1 hypothetical protein SRL2020130_56150 [Mycobacterium kiyosense]GLC05011.1 hypothetical protein SRL2020400_56020 [Mycobacterium kiyosense]GLC10582.1 hypothetical protein SRL2020411_52280 [Mycobacterium kiyosense]GLC16931.1 hypothetical protein SRL2020448_55340 [Mycobacterium kiyosense]
MSGGDGDQLRIILDQLSQLLGVPAPPMITSDQLATGSSAISQLLRALGAAANAGDAADNGEAQAGHAEREAKTNEALAKFPANEEQAATRLAGVAGQGEMSQMLQQMPQMASGIAGGIAGALGGLLQPFSQIPQQLAQAGQQAMQAGMGMMQHGAGAGEIAPGELLDAESELGGGSSFSGGGGGAAGGGGGGGIEGTTPTAMLGPPPTPTAGTVPASSQTVSSVAPAPHEAPAAQRGAMGAMPMMPPGAMNGSAGAGSETKPDTKRVVGPTVKNGAPVQGRITTPPPTPAVVKHVEGKPVATRRIVLPDKKRADGDADSQG